jgi:hypothetical protein
LGIALHHHQHPHLVFNFPSFPFWNCEAYAERRSLCRVPSDWALPYTTTNILIWYSISPHSLSDGEAYAERRSLYAVFHLIAHCAAPCRVPSDVPFFRSECWFIVGFVIAGCSLALFPCLSVQLCRKRKQERNGNNIPQPPEKRRCIGTLMFSFINRSPLFLRNSESKQRSNNQTTKLEAKAVEEEDCIRIRRLIGVFG